MDYKTNVIGVLMGGPSREREISLRSGKNVLQALQRKGYTAVDILVDGNNAQLTKELRDKKIDLAFNALHGIYGEDGQVQTLLRSLSIPYTGSGPEACRITMNKVLTKNVLRKATLLTPEFQVIHTLSDLTMDIPLVIKPALEGSSFGVSIIKDKKDLLPTLKTTLKDFSDVFVERFIKGRELTVGIIGTGPATRPLPVLELVPKNEFYDFEAKYTPGRTSFLLPAPLSAELTKKIQDHALAAHTACGCDGVSRVDFILDDNETPWITEINAIPGMTDQSDLPAEAKADGIPFDDLVETILFTAHT